MNNKWGCFTLQVSPNKKPIVNVLWSFIVHEIGLIAILRTVIMMIAASNNLLFSLIDSVSIIRDTMNAIWILVKKLAYL